jgi:hypothetical protein
MVKSRKKVESLERLLITSYRNQPIPELPEGWHAKVMEDILRASRQAARPRLSLLERLFQTPLFPRFAAACAACAAVMAVVFVTSGGGVNQEFCTLFMSDPMGLISLILFAL